MTTPDPYPENYPDYRHPSPPAGQLPAQPGGFPVQPNLYAPNDQHYPAPPVYPRPARTGANSMAVTSLWLGIAAMVCLGALTGIPAVITGILAKKKISESAAAETGDTQALWGIILGAVATLLSVLGLFLLIVGVIGTIGSPSPYDTYPY